MPYPSWTAGQRITAALLNAGKTEYVQNSAGAQTNATTTLANATGLVFAVEANAKYMVTALISFDSPIATDIKFAWTAPAGASMGRNIISQSTTTTTNMDTNAIFVRRGTGTAQTVGGPNGGGGAPTATTFSIHTEIIDLVVSSTAGNAQLQFAANAAGTATLQADSIIYYQRIA
jgi:hypothetical protein